MGEKANKMCFNEHFIALGPWGLNPVGTLISPGKYISELFCSRVRKLEEFSTNSHLYLFQSYSCHTNFLILLPSPRCEPSTLLRKTKNHYGKWMRGAMVYTRSARRLAVS